MIVHGLDLSYFSGKLEAYLRAKGLAYRFEELSMASFRRCARATGVAQMPQVELADGRWLTDTTQTIAYFEAHAPGPAILPEEPLARFMSLLIEDFGDEALWRPALYYRWVFAEDARLMSGRIAAGMLRDMPGPLWLRRAFILHRQRRVYLREDGVTGRTAPAIEALYRATLAAMEQALAQRPFVLGARPSPADFGLFGAMFRHFGSDPTPLRILLASAPRTYAWLGRLWSLTPDAFAEAAHPEGIAPALEPLAALIADAHLPELDAHARAFVRGERYASWASFGATFRVPASPYKAWALDTLRRGHQSLAEGERSAVEGWLGAAAAGILSAAPVGAPGPPSLPIATPPASAPRDRRLA